MTDPSKIDRLVEWLSNDVQSYNRFVRIIETIMFNYSEFLTMNHIRRFILTITRYHNKEHKRAPNISLEFGPFFLTMKRSQIDFVLIKDYSLKRSLSQDDLLNESGYIKIVYPTGIEERIRISFGELYSHFIDNDRLALR